MAETGSAADRVRIRGRGVWVGQQFIQLHGRTRNDGSVGNDGGGSNHDGGGRVHDRRRGVHDGGWRLDDGGCVHDGGRLDDAAPHPGRAAAPAR